MSSPRQEDEGEAPMMHSVSGSSRPRSGGVNRTRSPRRRVAVPASGPKPTRTTSLDHSNPASLIGGGPGPSILHSATMDDSIAEASPGNSPSLPHHRSPPSAPPARKNKPVAVAAGITMSISAASIPDNEADVHAGKLKFNVSHAPNPSPSTPGGGAAPAASSNLGSSSSSHGIARSPFGQDALLRRGSNAADGLEDMIAEVASNPDGRSKSVSLMVDPVEADGSPIGSRPGPRLVAGASSGALEVGSVGGVEGDVSLAGHPVVRGVSTSALPNPRGSSSTASALSPEARKMIDERERRRSRADSLNVHSGVQSAHQRRGSISQFIASVGRPRRDSVTALADSLLKRRVSMPSSYARIFQNVKEGEARREQVEGMTMNRWTRAFGDSKTEAAFGEYFFKISLRQVRLATWLAIAGVTLFAVGDEVDVGLDAPWDTTRLQVLFIRVALIASILIFLGLTFMDFFRKHMQTTLVTVFSAAGVLFAVMSLLKQSVGVVFMAIFLAFIYLVPRLRFMYGTIIILIAFVAWDIVYYLIFISTGVQNVSVFIIYNALLITAAALNMVTGYAMETYIRQDFLLKRTIEVEQEKTDGLLKSMLPASAVEKLKDGKHLIADQFQEVTMLMADVVGFTNLAAMLQPNDLVSLMNEVYSRFDSLADTHGVYKLETIGDAYMAVGGLPEPRADHADAMAEMALDMQKALVGINRPDGEPLQIRIGLHTGPVIAGVVGVKKMPRYWVWGETVLLSNRMEALGMPGKVHLSETTQRLLRRKFIMEEAKLDEKKTADLPPKAGQTYFLIARVHTGASTAPVSIRERPMVERSQSPLVTSMDRRNSHDRRGSHSGSDNSPRARLERRTSTSTERAVARAQSMGARVGAGSSSLWSTPTSTPGATASTPSVIVTGTQAVGPTSPLARQS